MFEIKIYQTNANYRFMDYDFAKSHNFDLRDYKEVACFDYDSNDLEEIFRIGNNGQLQQYFKMRSISVSDIIEVNNIKYYVDSFGFKEV